MGEDRSMLYVGLLVISSIMLLINFIKLNLFFSIINIATIILCLFALSYTS